MRKALLIALAICFLVGLAVDALAQDSLGGGGHIKSQESPNVSTQNSAGFPKPLDTTSGIGFPKPLDTTSGIGSQKPLGQSNSTTATGSTILVISDDDLRANAAGTSAITSASNPVSTSSSESQTKFTISGIQLSAYLVDLNGDKKADALWVPLSQKELSISPGTYNLHLTNEEVAPVLALDSNGDGKTDGLLFGVQTDKVNVNEDGSTYITQYSVSGDTSAN